MAGVELLMVEKRLQTRSTLALVGDLVTVIRLMVPVVCIGEDVLCPGPAFLSPRIAGIAS